MVDPFDMASTYHEKISQMESRTQSHYISTKTSPFKVPFSHKVPVDMYNETSKTNERNKPFELANDNRFGHGQITKTKFWGERRVVRSVKRPINTKMSHNDSLHRILALRDTEISLVPVLLLNCFHRGALTTITNENDN